MARILVADDDVDLRMLVSLKLEQSGHQVVAVEDGAAALAECRATRPDLVVLDVMMPRMSGLEVCAEIKADHALRTVPVVLLTARAQETDVRAGLEAGADEYVTKPFSPRDLASRVEALLAGSE